MPIQNSFARRRIHCEGAFFANHSLALVNREITLALSDDPRFELSIQHLGPRTSAAPVDARLAALEAAAGTSLKPDVTLHHSWPPDFSRPRTGKLVLIQPWEFGSIPCEWSEQISRTVDEIWAPSHFVRDTYLRAGVPADKVAMVPNGVNTNRFHPGVAPYDFTKNPKTRLLSNDTFKFLFVGGTIARKGIDVLLDAYDRAFTAKDNVALIIKDFGVDSFYAGQTASNLIQALQVKPGGAKIIYLTEDMTDEDIAGLYASCDCLVHPYRGEGYGLPIAEAMACGKPTVVTNYGAALDFANETNAYMIPATVETMASREIGGMETLEQPFWANPDREALSRTLLHIVANPEEAAAKGVRAAADIAHNHTWEHAARIAGQRLAALAPATESFVDTAGHAVKPGKSGIDLGISSAAFGHAAGNGGTFEDRKQTALADARARNWKDAVLHLTACLAERPNDMEVLNALAVAQFRCGLTEDAITLLQDGLKWAANKRDVHHNLAFVLLETNAPVEALEHARAALNYTSDNIDIRRTTERARDAVLHAARKVLRSYPETQRVQAKKDPRYLDLMLQYRDADEALKQNTQIASTETRADLTTENRGPARISLCLIARNEERFLARCLDSVRGIVDEIVLVDTGSTDRTMEIAARYGAKVIQYPWADDFAAARNISLEHATGDWALWLDADEEIAPESAGKIRQAVEATPPHVGGFMVRIQNWLQSTERKAGSEMAVHHACRLFRRVPGVRFEGRIHEQNLRSLIGLGYSYIWQEDLVLDHFGYAGEIMALRNKHERFIRMLRREVEECPDESLRAFQLFNLGNAYFTFGDMESAAKYLGQSVELADVAEEYTVTAFVELASALQRLGRSRDGLKICDRAETLGIEQAGLCFARGYCLLHEERYEEAGTAFQSAIGLGEQDQSRFAHTGDAGISRYKARYGLALALLGQERKEEAISCCNEALAEQPGFMDARYLLSILLTQLGRKTEARVEMETLLAQDPDHKDARRDLGRLLFDLEDYESALPFVKETAAGSGNEYDPQARLATCFERTGRLEEARAAYERLRLLAPMSSDVCVNLGRILAVTGSPSEAIDCFTEAIAIDPANGNAYFNAGDALYRLGYYGNAAETYLSGLEVAPEHPSGFFVLGNCYFQTTDYSAAVLSYRQALVMEPSSEEIQHNLTLAEEMAAQ